MAVKGIKCVFPERKRGTIMVVPTTCKSYYAVFQRVDVDPTIEVGPKLFGILINLTKNFGHEKHPRMRDTWRDIFRGLEL